mmetsp:Transcript_29941/g.86141  ORF Transcript_29941/g.86141 Transcript_29941/m.86141 type:complete len:217 (+) Transcript_29941:590-1240(+)
MGPLLAMTGVRVLCLPVVIVIVVFLRRYTPILLRAAPLAPWLEGTPVRIQAERGRRRPWGWHGSPRCRRGRRGLLLGNLALGPLLVLELLPLLVDLLLPRGGPLLFGRPRPELRAEVGWRGGGGPCPERRIEQLRRREPTVREVDTVAQGWRLRPRVRLARRRRPRLKGRGFAAECEGVGGGLETHRSASAGQQRHGGGGTGGEAGRAVGHGVAVA